MNLGFERIASRLFGQPHLYDVRKAETLVREIGPRLLGGALSISNGEGGVDHVAFSNGRPSAGVIGDRLGRAFDSRGLVPFDVIDNVAVIAVEGTLVQKGGWVGSNSGETSYQGLQTQITRALRSDKIKAVVFEVDSFGGQGNGAFETAAMIRDLSKAKPTIAILTDYAYSAGYLLASQTRQIVAPEFGGAGSIGVVMMHVDRAGELEQSGIKVTFIKSGERKVAGNSFEALPDDVRDRWQAQCDSMRQQFADAVAKGRRGRLTKAAALKTEAECFTAGEAVDLGLIDAVGDGQMAFAAFLKEVNKGS